MSVGRIPGASGIPTTTVLAKGDLIAGTAANAVTNLSVGTDGQTLVANSANASGLGWNQNFAAGKNKIINGDFGVWQRGTSFTATNIYCADRFRNDYDGSGTRTTTQQSFTPGSAPVSGYEAQYYLQVVQAATSGQTYSSNSYRGEDVRTYAGQTVTVSFWAKADAARQIGVDTIQFFGSGGSATVSTTIQYVTLSTSWTRYALTFSIPSITGKTIGSGNFWQVDFLYTLNTAQTISLWGLQVEAGSVATAFQTATGTLQGELQACQRYYERLTAAAAYERFGNGFANTTTTGNIDVFFKVPKRAAISSTVDYSTTAVFDGTVYAVTAITVGQQGINEANIAITVASGLTTNRFYQFLANNSTSAYVGFSAEL